MHLEVNEHEYMDPNYLLIQKTENAIPRLKDFCMKYIESSQVENFSFMVVFIYALFVIFMLTYQEFLSLFPGGADLVNYGLLVQIDLFFLIFFLVEIVLKSFASDMIYITQDKFSLFDAIIVLASFILNVIGEDIKGLGVLRLIRVVVIVVRKITGNK